MYTAGENLEAERICVCNLMLLYMVSRIAEPLSVHLRPGELFSNLKLSWTLR